MQGTNFLSNGLSPQLLLHVLRKKITEEYYNTRNKTHIYIVFHVTPIIVIIESRGKLKNLLDLEYRTQVPN